MQRFKNQALFLPFLLFLTLCACSKGDKIVIETTEVTKGDISETVTATGTLESVTQVDVGTQVTGIISELYADYNSVVKKGELIAEIEKTILQADLNSANATLQSAKATYDYTRTNFERDRKLHERQLISDYEFQTSQKDYEVARQNYEKAQSDRVRAAKNLNYAEIYSPIDGIVISRDVEVGQTVVSSMNVANLYTIADLDHMQVVGKVDEADIGRVKVGQKVEFTVDAYPDDSFSGTVTQVRLAATTESNVVTYEVIVSTSNEDHKLIPGLTANLTIYMLREKDILTIPLAATKFTPKDFPDAKNLPQPTGEAPKNDDPSKAVVWVVDGKKLTPKLVTLGATNGISCAVVSGLKEGEKLAVGYDAADALQAADKAKESQERSPFAPKGPGQRKK